MIPLAGRTPPSVDRVLMLAGHTPPSVDRELMLAGHTPPSVDRELMQRGVGPGGTRGKTTELLLFGPFLLSRPLPLRMLRTRPSLLKGIATSPSQRSGVMTRVRWAGTEQRIAPGPNSPGPEN